MIKEMQDLFTVEVLEQAAAFYGVPVEHVKSLGGFESFVYEYQKEDRTYILKINHDIRRSFDALMGEVDWLNALADHGVSVCKAVPTVDGIFVGTIRTGDSNFYTVSYEKAPGFSPEDLPDSWTDALFLNLGAVIGRMHQATKSYQPKHVAWKRQEWHEEEQLKARKYITGTDEELISFIETQIQRLNSHSKNVHTYGLVHSDISPRNFYTTSEYAIHVFDFDDIGYHYFVNDIAIVLYYALNYPPLEPINHYEYTERFISQFLKGYQMHNELERESLKLIPDFMRVRHALNYIIFHQTNSPDDLNAEGRAMLHQHRHEILRGTTVEENVRTVLARRV